MDGMRLAIYYSTDSGQTVKIAYSFGINPHFQQKGAPSNGHQQNLHRPASIKLPFK